MRIRVRGPKGQAALNLDDAATVADLRAHIKQSTELTHFDLKIGYPPAPFSLEDYAAEAKLSELPVKLNGEQLIASSRDPPPTPPEAKQAHPGAQTDIYAPTPKRVTAPASGKSPSPGLLALERKAPPTDPPELPLPSHAATVVLRIMPDDNSCLFRAFNAAYMGNAGASANARDPTADGAAVPEPDHMPTLRALVAQAILADAERYPAVVLEKDPRDYAAWIRKPASWGGAIELDILARHFGVEVACVDVQSLRVDRYNSLDDSVAAHQEAAAGSAGGEDGDGDGGDGEAAAVAAAAELQEILDRRRIILVYSGIHYDAIALSPSDPPHTQSTYPPEFDETVFAATDGEVLDMAVKLCGKLKEQKYFTDTGAFAVKCNVCGTVCHGEKGATEHAKQTGHYDFGET